MSAYDDLFDVRVVFERWEDTWYKWRSKADIAFMSKKDEKAALKAGCNVIKSLDCLAEQIEIAKSKFTERGWGSKKQKKKQ